MREDASTNTIKLQHWRASQAEKPLEAAPVLGFQNSIGDGLSRTPICKTCRPGLTRKAKAQIDFTAKF